MINYQEDLKVLINSIQNFYVSANVLFPYRLSKDLIATDSIEKFGYELMEISDIEINGCTTEEFSVRINDEKNNVIKSLERDLLTTTNRSEALSLYSELVSQIETQILFYTNLKGKKFISYIKDKGIFYGNINELEYINFDTLSAEELKVFKLIVELIQNMLNELIMKAKSDYDIIGRTKLKDFKQRIRNQSQIDKPSLLNGYYSFKLNNEVSHNKTGQTFKLTKLYETLTEAQLIDNEPITKKNFLDLFSDTVPLNKITLKGDGTKAFLLTLLQQLHRRKIILNKDYHKAAEAGFVFEIDRSYDWGKFRKTSKTKKLERIELIEKCVKLFL